MKHKFTSADALLIFEGLGAIIFGWLLRAAVKNYVLELDELAGFIAVASFLYFIFGIVNLFCGLMRVFGIYQKTPFQNLWDSTSLKEFWLHRFKVSRLKFSYFLIVGIICDVLMSLPVDAGYGKCTAYFLIQGCALVFENRFFHKFFLKHPWFGGTWTYIIVLIPLPLLFHWDFRDFVLNRFTL